METDLHLPDVSIEKINWSGQLELFPVTAGGVLEEINLTNAMGTLLFEKGFLSFDPVARGDLTPAEAAELEFVGTLFSSGLPLAYIERMLAELEPPFSYSIHDCYWDWRASKWRPLPSPPPSDQVTDQYLETCFFEGDEFRLVELRDKIEDMLFRISDSLRKENE